MKPQRTTAFAVLALCVASFALMLGSSLRDSAVVDEIAHIPAGYAYDRYFDYRLNPEHPPIVKALAALPLLGMNLQYPLNNPFWTTAVNGEWGVGGAMLYGIQNDATAIIDWARVFPMILTLILIIFTYTWGRRLYGPWWALLPAFLVGLSPIILAHGHYVTTDISAALGAMLGLYSFVAYLESPSRKNFFFAAVGFGVAEMMKFSTVILAPLYVVLAIINAVAHKENPSKKTGVAFLLIIVGYLLVVYPLYALFTANYPIARQASDTSAILGALPSASCALASPMPCFARFDLWAASNPIARPFAEYLLGVIMVVQRISGTNVSYFLGMVYTNGTQLYFPVMYGLKEPLPTLLLVIAGAFLGLFALFRALPRARRHVRRYLLENFAQFSMLCFVILYWAWSIMSPLNIGIRHLIPTLPLIYLLAASALRKLPPSGFWIVGALLVWLAAETIIAYPRYLSYYNEIGGGTNNGYRFADDSNYDWGQDIYELRMFLDAHPEVDRVAFDFFGGSNPAYYLGAKYVPWRSSMGDPSIQGIHWFAVSITNLEDGIQPAAPGFSRDAKDRYPWLTSIRARAAGMGGVPPPDYRVGTTIFVYKV